MEVPFYVLTGAGGAVVAAVEYALKYPHMTEEMKDVFREQYGLNFEVSVVLNTIGWIVIGMGIGSITEFLAHTASVLAQ